MKSKFNRHHSAEERFWGNIHKTKKCWIWGSKPVTDDPYQKRGSIRVKGRRILASRYSWELHFGDIPTGLFVCHRCDNPRCVRPDHLFLGTHTDNMRDSWNKGRRSHAGQDHPQTDLTDVDVGYIRSMYRTVGPSNLANQFKLSRQQIWRIYSGKCWRKGEKPT